MTDIRLINGERIFVRERMGASKKNDLTTNEFDIITRHYLVHNTYMSQTSKYLSMFKKNNMVVSFDYSYVDNIPYFAKTLPYTDIAFLSRPNISLQEAKKIIKEIFGYNLYVLIITRGNKGSLAYDGKNIYVQPALPVNNIIDTLGAGDSFIGSFLASQLKNQTIEKSLQEAACYASKTCQHLGAWIPK